MAFCKKRLRFLIKKYDSHMMCSARMEDKMKEKLDAIKENALSQIKATDSLEKLNDIRVAFLGKKGELTEVLKGMKEVAPEDRPKVGQIVNETRQAIEEVLDAAKKDLAAKKRELQMKAEVIDVTLPAKKAELGHKHPNTLAREEIEKIFIGMGYEVVEGPEVEYDRYNFELLNIPANHPAKDEQDTFYINDEVVLRTQTYGSAWSCNDPLWEEGIPASSASAGEMPCSGGSGPGPSGRRDGYRIPLPRGLFLLNPCLALHKDSNIQSP